MPKTTTQPETGTSVLMTVLLLLAFLAIAAGAIYQLAWFDAVVPPPEETATAAPEAVPAERPAPPAPDADR